jgi:hypothetical protein
VKLSLLRNVLLAFVLLGQVVIVHAGSVTELQQAAKQGDAEAQLIVNAAKPSEITYELIFQSFPICKISSYFGQICKVIGSESNFKDVVDYIDGNVVTKNLIEIDSTDSYSSIELLKYKGERFEVIIVHRAKFGTYLTEVKYFVEWSDEDNNWVLVGEMALYISGNEEDKMVENIYVAYENAIPFLGLNFTAQSTIKSLPLQCNLPQCLK